MGMSIKMRTFLLTFVLTLVADLGLKEWVLHAIPYPTPRTGEITLIPDLFSLVHAKNPGAAFSAMRDFEGRMYVFAVFTVIAVVALGWAMRALRPEEKVQPLAIGLMLAGVLGNACDRLRFQEVTDMFKLYAGFEPLRSWTMERFGTNIWPIFNIADVVLLVGVGIFILRYLFERDSTTAEVDPGQAPDVA